MTATESMDPPLNGNVGGKVAFGVCGLRQQLRHCGNDVAVGTLPAPVDANLFPVGVDATIRVQHGNSVESANQVQSHEDRRERLYQNACTPNIASTVFPSDRRDSLSTIATTSTSHTQNSLPNTVHCTTPSEEATIHNRPLSAFVDGEEQEARSLAFDILNNFARHYLHPEFKLSYR